MIKAVRWVQLAVSAGVIALFWLIYPGVLVLFATLAGLVYLAFAVGALLGNSVSVYTAFGFSSLTAVLSTLGSWRFVADGFDFFAGNWGQQSAIFIVPYVFLLLSVGAIFVAIAQLVIWLSPADNGSA